MTMQFRSVRHLFTGATLCLLAAWTAEAQSTYLPLEPGNKWTLRNPRSNKTIVIEVMERKGDEYRISFDSPYGANEWILQPEGDKYYMTQFGNKGKFADLPSETVYFDFGAPEKATWKNVTGTLSIQSKNASLEGDGATYNGVIQIKQSRMLFSFADGTGFVQFGEGKNAFILDPSESRIGKNPPQRGDRPSTREGFVVREKSTPADDNEPVQHVPTPNARSSRQERRQPMGRSQGRQGKVLFSITPNAFANESNDPMNLLRNFDRVVNTGMGFLVHNAKWNEFEPRPGKFETDGLNFNVETARKNNIPIAYTFRLIETVDRAMPSDLARLKWTDKKVEARLRRVIEEIVKTSGNQIRWFMLGNEIDGYFGRHPDEVEDFARLFGRMKQHIKELNPSIQVSTTLMFGGVATLDDSLRPLDSQLDFLSFTYYPIRGDFTMKDPGVVSQDVARMRQAADGRKVILQEVGYPSGSRNNSNEDKQAQFYQNIFTELRANGDMVEAACFWVMADLKDEFVRDLSHFYGINNSETFKSFLQTLGMFDGRGRPKKAWQVYEREARK